MITFCGEGEKKTKERAYIIMRRLFNVWPQSKYTHLCDCVLIQDVVGMEQCKHHLFIIIHMAGNIIAKERKYRRSVLSEEQ